MSYSEVTSGNQRQAGNLQCLPCSPRWKISDGTAPLHSVADTDNSVGDTLVTPCSPLTAQSSQATHHPTTHLSNTLLTYIWASMKREQMWRTKRNGEKTSSALSMLLITPESPGRIKTAGEAPEAKARAEPSDKGTGEATEMGKKGVNGSPQIEPHRYTISLSVSGTLWTALRRSRGGENSQLRGVESIGGGKRLAVSF
ncbi:uncharacterized protein LOC123257402 [Drosophila ananassae]|uniref:uncharacterized protein LOC123257402 n=1 Tax=Drosophila ananassae TaxID=7217 RepID=UPI001CFFF9F3|nr:uncharacterized protein LOC123257402 [Drosophila ananassae]